MVCLVVMRRMLIIIFLNMDLEPSISTLDLEASDKAFFKCSALIRD